jgi:hypothetical protein
MPDAHMPTVRAFMYGLPLLKGRSILSPIPAKKATAQAVAPKPDDQFKR